MNVFFFFVENQSMNMNQFLLDRIRKWDENARNKNLDVTIFRDNIALRYFTDFSIVSGFYLLFFHNNNSRHQNSRNPINGALIVPTLEYNRAIDNCKDLPLEVVRAEDRSNITKAFGAIRRKHSLRFDKMGLLFDSLTLQDYGNIFKHSNTGLVKGTANLTQTDPKSPKPANKDRDVIYFPDSKYVTNTTPIFAHTRKIKDKQEIARIRRAAEITDKAMNTGLASLKPGMREIEIAALLEYEMKKNGAEDKSFDTIVASGLNSSYPHAGATDRIIQAGDLVTIDMGATYEGYHADLTRTVIISGGGEDPRYAEIINEVNKSQKAALDVIGPDVVCEDVDRAARTSLKNVKFDQYFIHGLGHGVGLDVHDPFPRLAPGVKYKLRPGMVVTVEPGVYIPKVGGARTEDLVLITESGYEKLSNSPIKWY